MDSVERSEQTQRSRAWRVLAGLGAVIACLPPAALMGFGLISLLFGTVRLTWGSALLYLLLPGLVLFLLLRLFRRAYSVGCKLFLGLCLWGLLAVGVFSASFWTFFLPLESHAVLRENAAERFLLRNPRLELVQSLDLGAPEAAVLHDCARLQGLFFDTEVSAILCRYGRDYDAQKARLEAALLFQEEPLVSSDPETRERCEFAPAQEIGGDLFRFLKPGEGYTLWFGKFCVLLITNDETREIGILIYDNIELDSVPDIIAFIRYDCCWDMIR